LEAPVDGRCCCDERQLNNQPDKRHERGAMRGGSVMRGRGAGAGVIAFFAALVSLNFFL
jgi:hypothetical protein